jgi:hypothetical protein
MSTLTQPLDGNTNHSPASVTLIHDTSVAQEKLHRFIKELSNDDDNLQKRVTLELGELKKLSAVLPPGVFGTIAKRENGDEKAPSTSEVVACDPVEEMVDRTGTSAKKKVDPKQPKAKENKKDREAPMELEDDLDERSDLSSDEEEPSSSRSSDGSRPSSRKAREKPRKTRSKGKGEDGMGSPGRKEKSKKPQRTRSNTKASDCAVESGGEDGGNKDRSHRRDRQPRGEGRSRAKESSSEVLTEKRPGHARPRSRVERRRGGGNHRPVRQTRSDGKRGPRRVRSDDVGQHQLKQALLNHDAKAAEEDEETDVEEVVEEMVREEEVTPTQGKQPDRSVVSAIFVPAVLAAGLASKAGNKTLDVCSRTVSTSRDICTASAGFATNAATVTAMTSLTLASSTAKAGMNVCSKTASTTVGAGKLAANVGLATTQAATKMVGNTTFQVASTATKCTLNAVSTTANVGCNLASTAGNTAFSMASNTASVAAKTVTATTSTAQAALLGKVPPSNTNLGLTTSEDDSTLMEMI